MDDRSNGSGEVGRDAHGDDTAQVRQILDFVLMIDVLKQVVRQNPVASGERRERTAEHSWHVAMAVVCLYEHAAEKIDIDKALRLAVIHDLPEVLVGDTFVYGARAATRRAREQRAIDELLDRLPATPRELIHESWTEYEYESSPEGRYVMALDVLLPIFLNLAAGRSSSWYRHNVAAADVRNRVEHVRAAVPHLATLALRAIDDGVRQGLLVEKAR